VKGTTQNNGNEGLLASVPYSGWNWKWFDPLDADAGTAIWRVRLAQPRAFFNEADLRAQATPAAAFGCVRPTPARQADFGG
jgi:hypothetical protein